MAGCSQVRDVLGLGVSMPAPLPQKFFARDTITVARALVGCRLRVMGKDGVEVSGRIVEVEAYEGENDPASHAGRGRTPRSEIMFGPAGVAYVYLIYGMHHCLNFVTETEGTPGAVLIRAMEPQAGRNVMVERRGGLGKGLRDRDLCSGPGRLCQALGMHIGWNGVAIVEGLTGKSPVPSGEIRIFVRCL
jgi:DNA-3-methyladenine glycosylase